MTHRPEDTGQSGLPRTKAALYAQAQGKPGRYGDFSASRFEVRQQFGRLQKPPASAVRITLAALPEPKPFLFQESMQNPAKESIQHLSEELAPEPSSSSKLEPDSLLLSAPRPGRWYALNSVVFPSQGFVNSAAGGEERDSGYPPALVVVSAAGGVGKTCLVATLGRALAAVGEQVLLADRSRLSLLPFYFAAHEIKPGIVRTFASPMQGGRHDAPVRVLTLEPSSQSDGDEEDRIAEQLLRHIHDTSRLLLDAGTADRGLPRKLQSLLPTILAPILPDMSSLASLASLERRLGGTAVVHYVLNQFDPTLPLHLDVRALLQDQLGSRMLPVVLHRSPAVGEALADGMTVIDYEPDSEIAEDYHRLAEWLRRMIPPAAVTPSKLRWTER